MAVIRSWGGDGLTAGAVTTGSVGTGDTAFSATQGTPTIVESGARSPRISIPDAAGAHNVRWWPLAGSALTNLACRCYITITGTPGEATIFRAAAGGAEKWAVRLRTSGRIGLYSDAAWRIPGVNDSIPVDGSLLRVEAVATGTTVDLYVYAGHSDTVLASGTTTAALSGVDEVWFGKASGAQTSSGLTLDDLAVSDTAALIGPSVVESVPLDTPANFSLVAAAGPAVGLTATWDAVTGAATYELEIERLDGGSYTPWLTDENASSPYTLDDTDGLVAGTTYRARVRALPEVVRAMALVSDWSDWDSATTWKSAWRLVTGDTPIILTPHLVT